MDEQPDTSGLRHLVADSGRRPSAYNPFYSRFIRWMRLALPLAALAIAAVIFTWNSEQKKTMIAQDAPKANKAVGKNELLNPHFENTDDNNQPYTITAARAAQDETDPDLALLDKPSGDMMLNDGHWVAIQSETGTLQQTERQLFLRGNVTMFHDGGYQLETPELHIDVPARHAWSDKEVHGQGPIGTLEATGLDGKADDGILIFTGPAKVVLDAQAPGFQSGGLFR